MSDLKLCPNGHYYPPEMAQCPYCPKPLEAANTSSSGYSKTSNEPNDGKTQIFNQPTQGSGERTVIFTGTTNQTSNTPNPVMAQNARKLVAFIITFDFNPFGKDFKIYEGRNTIGKAKEREIVIDFDSKISAHHLTLLYRMMDGFSFKDELSTNGTFLNGEFVNGGPLKDGDILRIGDTNFLFRTVF